MTAKNAFVSALSAALIACGGGGGDAPEPQQPEQPAAQYPVEAAFRSVLTTDRTFTASFTPSGGPTYTVTQRFFPTGEGTVNGVPHKTTFVTTQVGTSGNFDTAYVRYFFLESPLTLAGHRTYISNTQPTTSAVYVQDGPIPTTAAAGASGPLVHYTESSLSGTVTWSLTAATASTAWFCLHITVTTGEVHCYLVDTAGNVSAAKYSARVNGVTVTFQ